MDSVNRRTAFACDFEQHSFGCVPYQHVNKTRLTADTDHFRQEQDHRGFARVNFLTGSSSLGSRPSSISLLRAQECTRSRRAAVTSRPPFLGLRSILNCEAVFRQVTPEDSLPSPNGARSSRAVATRDRRGPHSTSNQQTFAASGGPIRPISSPLRQSRKHCPSPDATRPGRLLPSPPRRTLMHCPRSDQTLAATSGDRLVPSPAKASGMHRQNCQTRAATSGGHLVPDPARWLRVYLPWSWKYRP